MLEKFKKTILSKNLEDIWLAVLWGVVLIYGFSAAIYFSGN